MDGNGWGWMGVETRNNIGTVDDEEEEGNVMSSISL